MPDPECARASSGQLLSQAVHRHAKLGAVVVCSDEFLEEVRYKIVCMEEVRVLSCGSLLPAEDQVCFKSDPVCSWAGQTLGSRAW